ncbi:bifunctional 2-polyprenyl-6-hydroxyphenol methylase/3-demethylubiquinol 3-O-methyltransferase UbiG [Arthrobacter sp. ok362]|jgi:SAM-dependent methyltransferase|uniref:class I SAM-dependent methyltransferase n=1 Tax=Arthrobacter sp. ok362 TaxID=1761745 RepID=UPI000881308E|nr:class I SAM-dependent methyltransferase [Arthrobacter sp. ok362]SDL43340.1 Methyltransferase domain-containing protein [Arthrobacter sp. ok362]
MTVSAGPAPVGLFGQGAHEPYECALRLGGGTLTLRPAGQGSGPGDVSFDVQGWCAEATVLEVLLLQSLNGPVLDVGCGPGRLLSAAQSLGLAALGVDTSPEAVRYARGRGARALERSIFAVIPQSGSWGSILLLDGNIGIGGSVTALLRRCRQLIAAHGTLLVEVEADDVDVVFPAVLEDAEGHLSDPFCWARAGTSALASRAERTGWSVASTQRLQGRVFCRLRPV